MSPVERNREKRDRDTPVVVKTPIEEYRHPRTLSRISLVGMIHIGQPAYYTQVQAEVQQRQDDRDGVVHYELTRKPSEQELTPIDEPLKRLLEDKRASMLSTLGMFEFPGIIGQREGLTYLSDWENHDADMLDVIRRIGAFTIRRQLMMAKATAKLFTLFDEDERLAMFTQMADKGMRDKRHKSMVAKLLIGDTDPVVLDYRNDIATNAIDDRLRQDPDSDIVLIWGAGHLPGLGRNLRRRGYEMHDRTTLTAIDPATLPRSPQNDITSV